MSDLLDGYIARFQNLPSWNIHAVAPDGLSHFPWMEVTGDAIATELIFDEINPMHQIDTVAADIQKWGRLESQAQRVWTMAERDFRCWKARCMVEAHDSADKTPAKHIIEAQYRTQQAYTDLSVDVERAEEAYNATRAAVDGFRAKRDTLMRFARKYRDG